MHFSRLGKLKWPMVLGLALGAFGVTGADHWPQFRGPGGSGICAQAKIPVHFGPNSNVLWKVSLPEGHSSPCIWGDRIFLTGFTNGQLATLCLERQTGRVLWQQEIEPAKVERGTQLSSPANSTPAVDAHNVYVYFGSFGLVCYSHEGKERWRVSLPTPVTQHGTGTSPVVAGDIVLLNCDQDMDSYLLAVNKADGQTRWRVDRGEFRRGFSTPLVWPAENPQLAIVAGTLRLVAYDLKDGSIRWTVSGLPNEMVSSPTAGEGMIYVAGWTSGAGVRSLPKFDSLLEQGDKNKDSQISREEAPSGPARQHFIYIDADKDGQMTRQEWESMAVIFEKAQNVCLAVKPDGQGDVTATHVVWKQTRGLPYVPTPLCYQGQLYLVKNGGLASCFEAKTGKVVYLEERLGAMGDNYSSPIAAGDKICVISQAGIAVIYKAGDTLEILARNPLGEPVLATPAVAHDILYVRTKTALYAFRQAP